MRNAARGTECGFNAGYGGNAGFILFSYHASLVMDVMWHALRAMPSSPVVVMISAQYPDMIRKGRERS